MPTVVAVTRAAGRGLRIALSGEVDAVVRDELHEVFLDPRLREADQDVVVDVGAVTFMDSTGVAFLARLGSVCRGRVRLVDATPFLQNVLRITGVDALLRMEEAEDQR